MSYFYEAVKFGIKVCLHIELYKSLTVENLCSKIAYVNPHISRRRLEEDIGQSSTIYDSYQIHPQSWAMEETALQARWPVCTSKHRFDIKKANFVECYIYFASNGFSYGSSWKNWREIATYAFMFALLFVPSIGPGYADTRIRPWNGKNTANRREGGYYEAGWRAASFNEWGGGNIDRACCEDAD